MANDFNKRFLKDNFFPHSLLVLYAARALWQTKFKVEYIVIFLFEPRLIHLKVEFYPIWLLIVLAIDSMAFNSLAFGQAGF